MIKKLAIYTAIALFVAGPVFADESKYPEIENYRQKLINLKVTLDHDQAIMFSELTSAVTKMVKKGMELSCNQGRTEVLIELIDDGVITEEKALTYHRKK